MKHTRRSPGSLWHGECLHWMKDTKWRGRCPSNSPIPNLCQHQGQSSTSPQNQLNNHCSLLSMLLLHRHWMHSHPVTRIPHHQPLGPLQLCLPELTILRWRSTRRNVAWVDHIQSNPPHWPHHITVTLSWYKHCISEIPYHTSFWNCSVLSPTPNTLTLLIHGDKYDFSREWPQRLFTNTIFTNTITSWHEGSGKPSFSLVSACCFLSKWGLGQ
jgi:hypothetical protein